VKAINLNVTNLIFLPFIITKFYYYNKICHSTNVYSEILLQLLILLGPKWEWNELTFRVLRYPDIQGLARMAVDEVVEQAFATWASNTNLIFRRVSEHANINIEFVEPDQPNFKNKTSFGYTYPPPIGTVYFNADWGWSIRNSSGTSYRTP
jgi:hypothetical protein